ncbi:MAG: DUF3817 domain-containing protein [Fulvivirga sp.]|uniref:DUF3817 domain-containing protein n=1 Tax=Fulvivirga sp. TaxID=1931237 RepID=UPI0032EE35C9
MQLLKSINQQFKFIAHAEGISLLLILFITMPLKYIMEWGMPNKVVGMAHGILFLIYVVFILVLAIDEKWQKRKLFIGLLASILPFGTFYFVKRWL